MDIAGWAAIAAWAGAAIALGTGFYTRAQARTARSLLRESEASRKASEDQANSARKSASAALKSAEAAIWQAKVGEAQLKLAESGRDRADAPEFDMVAEPRAEGIVRVTVTMTKGVPGLYVRAGWSAESVYMDDDGVGLITHSMGEPLCPQAMFVGSSIMVEAKIPNDPEHYRYGTVRLTLNCEEMNGERAWPYAKVAKWSIPEPSRSAMLPPATTPPVGND